MVTMIGNGEPDTATVEEAAPGATPTKFFAPWTRRTRIWAAVFAALTLLVSVPAALMATAGDTPAGAIAALATALLPPLGVYVWQTAPVRRRHAILRLPFPPEWEAVLQRDVLFFRTLDPASKRRFRRLLQVFLG